MNISDLKLKIFRKIDSMEKDRLEEFYGVLVNFINKKRDIEDWEKLTNGQQQGILDAIEELESGKGIPHETVMENMRNKF